MDINKLTLVVINCLFFANFTFGRIPCRLKRDAEDYAGYLVKNPIPKGAISLGGYSNAFIVGTEVNGYNIGTYHDKSSTAYIPHNETHAESYTYCEMLTNSKGCSTEWVNGIPKPEYAVETPTGYFIGRIMVNGNYYAGQINYNLQPPEFTVAIEDLVEMRTSGFQALISHSPGITMTLEDVEIQIEPTSDDVNAIAVEEIRNNGNAIISQTVVHKKTIKEKYVTTIPHESIYRSSSVHSCGWNIWFWFWRGYAYSYNERHTYTETKTETWTTEKTTEIDLVRTITVPPSESVQVCSIVTIKDKIDIEYEGNMVYTAPTLSAEEIADILALDKPPVYVTILNGKAVLPKVAGKFQGSVAMQSAFYVVDMKDGVSCLEAAQEQTKKDMQHMQNLKHELLLRAQNGTLSNI